MTLSKINEPVTITPYKSSEISFELSRAYSTPSLNVSAAYVFQLNQICDAFNNLRHIHFPYMAKSAPSLVLTPLHSPIPLMTFKKINNNRLVSKLN